MSSNKWTTIKMDLKILEDIGLSKAEIKVYVTLLETGSTPPARIVEETGLRRSTIYDSIRRLHAKGLISYIIKDSKRYYEAHDPDRLLDFMTEKKRCLEEQTGEIEELINELKEGYDILKPSAEAHVLAGVEGFKTMRRDVLKNARGEHLLLGAISYESDVMPTFFKNWNTSRQLKKIRMRVLHKESAKEKAMTKKEFMGKYYENRFLPDELESPAVINIYGDRVVNILWKKDYPVCFMLINDDIADSHRKYFEYLWKKAKK